MSSDFLFFILIQIRAADYKGGNPPTKKLGDIAAAYNTTSIYSFSFLKVITKAPFICMDVAI